MAGMEGFEPSRDGAKTRCLTAWLHPSKRRDVHRPFQSLSRSFRLGPVSEKSENARAAAAHGCGAGTVVKQQFLDVAQAWIAPEHNGLKVVDELDR